MGDWRSADVEEDPNARIYTNPAHFREIRDMGTAAQLPNERVEGRKERVWNGRAEKEKDGLSHVNTSSQRSVVSMIWLRAPYIHESNSNTPNVSAPAVNGGGGGLRPRGAPREPPGISEGRRE